ncbi:hypothetical protein PIB30_011536 [Stylosanthes scabra]|uniref:Uncharacterized protein n=1 Tax=Stylosanthes scabra TaxID=79078 RepID=A0ABU6T6Q3_9FABA|nr:hypothetical protein [Stylosanthes scabra]
MQAKAKEFIHHKEVNRVVAATKNQQSQTAPRGNASAQYQRDNQREHGSRGNPKPSKQKYDHYTQDCYDLKDAIEQAIREGKLNEFTQIIREPRNPGREWSEGPETRNSRNLRDTDETMPIVPVITGANHTEKSMSAHKKNPKILAVVRSAPPQLPPITFDNKDFEHGMADSDAPMVISAGVGSGIVRRILIDTAVFTKFLVMKYETDSDSSDIYLADLDARIEEQPRPKPDGDLEKIQIGDSLERHSS